MLLLHSSRKTNAQDIAKPPAPAPKPGRFNVGRVRNTQVRHIEQPLVPRNTYTDVLAYSGTDIAQRSPYLGGVVRSQASPRVRRKHTALVAGGFTGALGLVWGLLAGPFFPVVGAGSALVGAAVGAAMPIKEPAPFRQVRKHMFYKSGIVETRAQSAALVAALKKGKILHRGRTRDILTLAHLDAVLNKQTALTAKQRRRVRESLEFIAKEAPHFDALAEESLRVRMAIEYARGLHRGERTVAPDLARLYERQARIKARLDGKPPSGPRHVSLIEGTKPPPAPAASPAVISPPAFIASPVSILPSVFIASPVPTSSFELAAPRDTP